MNAIQEQTINKAAYSNIPDGAMNKCKAMQLDIALKLQRLEDKTPHFAISQELIDKQIDFQNKELKVWEYLEELIINNVNDFL